MMFYLAEANVDARKHGEYECLDEGHQKLEAVEEDTQQDTYHRHGAIADTVLCGKVSIQAVSRKVRASQGRMTDNVRPG